jgi:hypothetical protein
VQYKEYSIIAVEREPGSWCAEIRRLDGKLIKAVGSSDSFAKITTPVNSLSAEDALKLAQKGIDGGGMSCV